MQVIITQPVKAPEDATWKALSDLDAMGSWASDVEEARLKKGSKLAKGAVRSVRFAKPLGGTHHVHERVLDVGDRNFRYEAVGGLGPYPVARMAWSVSGDGDVSAVSLVATMQPAGLRGRLAAPFAKPRLKKRLRVLLQDLAQHVEEAADRPSPPKAKAGARKGKPAKTQRSKKA